MSLNNMCRFSGCIFAFNTRIYEYNLLNKFLLLLFLLCEQLKLGLYIWIWILMKYFKSGRKMINLYHVRPTEVHMLVTKHSELASLGQFWISPKLFKVMLSFSYSFNKGKKFPHVSPYKLNRAENPESMSFLYSDVFEPQVHSVSIGFI